MYQRNIHTIVVSYEKLEELIKNLDSKLMVVLKRHEIDFLNAYKSHIGVVLQELKFLREKTEEQERNIKRDSEAIVWYKEERERMLEQRSRHLFDLNDLDKKEKAYLQDIKEHLENEVKAI